MFGGTGQHIYLSSVDKQLSPEAGVQLALPLPGSPIVIGAENKGQILRGILPEYIHIGQQKAVRMANDRGIAQK